MSNFTPLNLSVNSQKANGEDEDTRELQLEQGLKLFQNALKLQKDLKYDEALEQYKQLFKLDILRKKIKDSAAAPQLSQLKYLCHKNRALLNLQINNKQQAESLKESQAKEADSSVEEVFIVSEVDERESNSIFGTFRSIVEDLLTALEFCESSDEELLNTLFDLFQYFDSPKLTRLLLELALDVCLENNMYLAHSKWGSPVYRKIVNRYKSLMVSIYKNENFEFESDTFSFFARLKKEDMQYRKSNARDTESIAVQLSQRSVAELLAKLETLYDNDSRTSVLSTLVDPLVASNYDTTDKVLIQISSINTENVKDEKEENEQIIVDDVEEIEKPQTVLEDKRKQEHFRSKRSRGQDVITSSFRELQDEFDKLRMNLETIGVKDDIFVQHLVKHYCADDGDIPHSHLNSKEESMGHIIGTLNSTLRNWTKGNSLAILQNNAKQKKGGSLTDTFNAAFEVSNGDSQTFKQPSDKFEKLHNGFFTKALKSIENCNIYQARIGIFLALATDESEIDGDVANFVIDVPLRHMKNGSTFVSTLKKYKDYYSYMIRDLIQRHSACKLTNEHRHLLSLLAVFNLELCVDSYVGVCSKIRVKEAAAHTEAKKRLESQITFWLKKCEFLHSSAHSRCWFRYKWAEVLYMQARASVTPDASYKTLCKILEQILSKSEELKESNVEIQYANYKHFAHFSTCAVQRLLKQASVLTSFAQILKDQSSGGQSSEIVTLLTFVLKDRGKTLEKVSEHEKSVAEFVSTAPLELQLQLWDILFDCEKGAELENFCAAAKKMKKHFLSEQFSSLAQSQQSSQLLVAIRFFNEKLSLVLQKVIVNSKYNVKISLDSIGVAVFFLNMLLVYYLNKVSGSDQFMKGYEKAARYFETVIVNCVVLICSSLKSNGFSDKKHVEFLSNMHALLGYGHMCDAGDRLFLSMLQYEFSVPGISKIDMEVFQLVHCQYHLPLTLEYYSPYEHKTQEIAVTREDALKLCGLFLELSFEKRDPYFNQVKSDLKTILDTFYDAIGDPSKDNERVCRAEATIETYLDTFLDLKVFKDAFHGLLDLNLDAPNLDVVQVAKKGLYYVQGVQALALFKIRKRTMQGRSAELDFVIKMFMLDLICGTNRIESWILLGLSYSFLVEDDLIWTSDKLNSEKKYNTAILQKRTILCYLMAVNCLMKGVKLNTITNVADSDKKQGNRMVSTLWSLLSKELYASVMKPMSGLCYQLSSPKLYIGLTGYYESHFRTSMKNSTVYKLALDCFRVAVRENSKDWSNWYYMSFLNEKLEKNATLVLLQLLTACDLALKSGSMADPVIEPHYRLVSLTHKYLKSDTLSIQQALEYLRQDNAFFGIDFPPSVEDKKSFAELCCTLYLRILALDKKKWHHKPRFRLAEIYAAEFHDLAGAKEHLLHLVSLKTANKNLVTIWKPENERPGKHFIHTHDYVIFLVKCLESANALSSLCIVLKKLRRFGSGMVNMLEAWEMACQIVCQMVRKRLNVDAKYTESRVLKLNYTEFMRNSAQFLAYVQENGYEKLITKKELLLLYEISEIRRMNNGFGTTALIDDTFAAIYLGLYEKFLKCERKESTPAQPESPKTDNSTEVKNKKATPVKTKVARRDIYPRALAILKALQKDVDVLQKENEFVFDNEEKEQEQGKGKGKENESEREAEDSKDEKQNNETKSESKNDSDQLQGQTKKVLTIEVLDVDSDSEPELEAVRNTEIGEKPDLEKDSEPSNEPKTNTDVKSEEVNVEIAEAEATTESGIKPEVEPSVEDFERVSESVEDVLLSGHSDYLSAEDLDDIIEVSANDPDEVKYTDKDLASSVKRAAPETELENDQKRAKIEESGTE